jgi:hypothetical protein
MHKIKMLLTQKVISIALFSAVFIIILTLFYVAYSNNNELYPFFEDETIHFNSCRSFIETGSLKAHSFFELNYSKIGEFNWYGPGYSILYGGIGNIFGFHHGKVIIIFHFILLLFALFIIYIYEKQKGIWIGIFLLLSGSIPYLFTYAPALLNFCAGIFISLVLFKYIETDRNKNIILIQLLGLVFLFAFFRTTTIFFLFGILVEFVSLKKYLKSILLVLISLALVMIFMKYFTAPMFISAGTEINKLENGDIFSFIVTFIRHLKSNAITFYLNLNLSHISILISIAATTSLFLIVRNRLLGAVVLINFVFLTIMLGMYVASPFYMDKQICILLPLNIIAFVKSADKKAMITLLSVFLFLFPKHLQVSKNYIDEGQQAYHFCNTSSFSREVRTINNFFKSKKSTLVLINLEELRKMPYPFYIFASSFPLSKGPNQTIRYSVMLNFDYFLSIKNYSDFDYFLSTSIHVNEKLQLCGKTENFYIYSLIK